MTGLPWQRVRMLLLFQALVLSASGLAGIFFGGSYLLLATYVCFATAVALLIVAKQMQCSGQHLREQRHDFLNHLQVISGLVQMGKNQRALEYIQEAALAEHKPHREKDYQGG